MSNQIDLNNMSSFSHFQHYLVGMETWKYNLDKVEGVDTQLYNDQDSGESRFQKKKKEIGLIYFEAHRDV